MIPMRWLRWLLGRAPREAWLGGAVLLASLVLFALPHGRVEVELGRAIAWTGAGFLAVGLVRDVTIKLSVAPQACPPQRAGEVTLCFESLGGALLVLLGLAALVARVHHALDVATPWVGVWAGALIALSGLTKDVVLAFRLERNHLNVIPW